MKKGNFKTYLFVSIVATLAIVAVDYISAQQAVPVKHIQPLGAVALSPIGSWNFLKSDANGNLYTGGAGGGFPGQSAPTGYVQPYAMTALNPSGAWSYLHTDANGNLLTIGNSSSPVRALVFAFGEPGGTALTTGVIGYLVVPFGCIIGGDGSHAWSITVDAGTATIKFLKHAAGTAIPTGANSINTSGVSIASGTVIESNTTSDFTTVTITAGDILAANITATSGVGFISAQLVCQ